MLLVLLSYP